MISRFSLWHGYIVNPNKLEAGLRPNGAGIPCTSVLRIEAIGLSMLFPGHVKAHSTYEGFAKPAQSPL